MVFETKKINTETLSEYLTVVRTDLKLSIAEVAEKTGVQQKFLEFLENGRFHALPPDVYVFGFLKKLAILYAIDPEVLISQYKKERIIDHQVTKSTKYENVQTKKYLGRLVITPKVLSLTAGAAFVLLTIAYIIWQVFSINRTPNLEILQPQDRQVITQGSVNVLGKTDPGMSLSLNDQNIFVDSQGNFKTQVGVEQGPTQLLFVAKNKFDKSIAKTITVMGEAATLSDQVNVELQVSCSKDVVLTVVIDGGAPTDSSFHTGDKKTFTAKDKIILSTSDAGATSVVLNGQVIGPLGRDKEALKDIPFSAGATPLPQR